MNKQKKLDKINEIFEGFEVYGIDYIYDETIKLDKKEKEISDKIKKGLSDLNKYIDSEDFKNDFINTLMTDIDISSYQIIINRKQKD